MTQESRRNSPWLPVALLAVFGLVCVAVGIGLRTIWLPEANYTATADVPPNTPAVVTAPGVPEMMPGPVQITATGSPEQTLVIVRGREQDVSAWIGEGAAATITGLAAPRQLAVASADAGDLPSVAGSDLWIDSVQALGTVSYTYRPTTGRYQLLFGVAEGPGAPTQITFVWPRTVATPWSWPLIAAGAIALLIAAALALRALTRARRAAVAEVSQSLRPKVDLVKPGASASGSTDGAGPPPRRRGRHVAAEQDRTQHSSTPQDATEPLRRVDGASHDSREQKPAEQDPTHQDATQQDATQQDATQQDATRHRRRVDDATPGGGT